MNIMRKLAWVAFTGMGIVSDVSGTAYFWTATDGGPMDTVASWQKSDPSYVQVPGEGDDVVLQYAQSAPVTIGGDMSIAEFHFWRGADVILNFNGHVFTANSDASRMQQSSVARLVNGTFNSMCDFKIGTEANRGDNAFVVDGGTASVQVADDKSWHVGMTSSDNALVVTNGASFTGVVSMGYDSENSVGNAVRVAGKGSSFTVPSSSMTDLRIGATGGENLFEVCDGAVFSDLASGSSRKLLVGTWLGGKHLVSNGNVLRVRNATFTSVPWLYCGYVSSSNRVEFADGAQASLSVLVVGADKASADAPETCGNRVRISGANTVVTVASGVVIGFKNSHSNCVEIADGATLRNNDDIRIGREEGNCNGNVLSVSTGGTYVAARQWSLGRRSTSCGNAIVVDGGTFTDNSPDEAFVGCGGGSFNMVKVCNGGRLKRTSSKEVKVGGVLTGGSGGASGNEIVIANGGQVEIPYLTVGVTGTGNCLRVDDGELTCSGVLAVGRNAQGSLVDIRGSNSRIEVGPIVVNRSEKSDAGGTEIRFTLPPEGLRRVPLCSTEYNFYKGTKIVVDATDENIPSGRYVLAELDGEGAIDVSKVVFDIRGDHVHLDTRNPKEIAVKINRGGMNVFIR